MQAATLFFLALAIIIALIFEQVLLATILFIALVAIIIFFVLDKTARTAKKAGKSLSKGIVDDLEKAKGQNPKGVSEIGKMLEATGAKVGEAAWAKNNETYKSPDLAGRIGQGSKNLLDMLGRMFK